MMSSVVSALSAANIATVASLSVVSISSPTELISRTGSIGQSVICYQITATSDIHTIYAWETANSGGASSPYVLAASGSGFWVAVAGRYSNSAVSLNSTLSLTGQLTSTLATGTAPFVVASTTVVANLNASALSGATFAAPGAIGGGTPASGAFTTLTASSTFVGSSTVKGTGFLVGSNQVIGARVTGWGTPSSTLARTTFATYAGQTVSAVPTQAEVQAIDDHVKVLSQRLGAILTDLIAHGAIGT